MRVSFIVVNYNTKELTFKCVQSIKESVAGERYEIILIDNGSHDGSAEYLRRKFSDVHFILNKDNLGFAQANNQGFAIAKGDYVILVNSDVIVNRNAVEATLKFIELHNDVAIVGCNLLLGDTGAIQKFSFGYRPSALRIFNQFFGLFYLSKNIKLLRGITSTVIRSSVPVPVDWISGAYLVLRKKAYNEIGGFHSGYFFYVEDMEWCLRFKNAKWKIFLMPNVNVLHYCASSQKNAAQRTEMVSHWYRNLRSLFKEQNPNFNIRIFDVFALCGFSLRLLFSVTKDLFGKGNRKEFKTLSNIAILNNAIAGILGKL